jgi:hypothetical protein
MSKQVDSSHQDPWQITLRGHHTGTDAIKFVQTNREKLTMSQKANSEESKETDYDDGEDKSS